MSLIVEDGTGRSDADSFVSVATFKTYCDNRGKDYSSYSDTEIEQALRRGTTFMSRAFIYKGWKVNGRPQALEWPRAWVTDREGWGVDSASVPNEIIYATCEVALLEAATPGTMAPQVTLNESVKSEQVGPLRVEYTNIYNSPQDARPSLPLVYDLIGQFLSGSSNPYSFASSLT